MPLVLKTLNTKNLSSLAKEIIMASWRPGTGKQYHSYLGRREKFCPQKAIIVQDASVENGIDFLASLYEDGLGYSAINTARSALSSVLTSPENVTFGPQEQETSEPEGCSSEEGPRPEASAGVGSRTPAAVPPAVHPKTWKGSCNLWPYGRTLNTVDIYP
ncbi:hypothetical protein P5673_025790 [Acropora cervicornis]|uniref:Uncharacterized protein n=1 Tax=Acropora cervicornis TaxID=6130 RepID=A0AAD9Q1R6_ACRCE|nr:hypothetical protein P5673_025790 [Acropora cervicornis]